VVCLRTARAKCWIHGVREQRIQTTGSGAMTGMMKKISDFARSPQGRELIAKGKKMAQDPQNQRKLQELRSRLGRSARPDS
jgi:hypothetical protein